MAEYYAVSGTDAFGVYTYRQGAQKIASYLNNPEVIRCHSVELAFSMAKDNYNSYQYNSELSKFKGDLSDINFNEILFRREIRNMKQVESPCIFRHMDSHIY